MCRTRSYTLTLFKAEIKIHTAISRKVVGKNVHATIPKDNMGYVQYTVPDTGVLLLSFSTRRFMSTASPSILSNSLKNSELKTTHNTFRGCRVPFLGKMCTRQSRKVIWDMINTLFLTLTVEPTFVALL